MKTRMTSRQLLTSSLKSDSTTTIKPQFIGIKEIVNPNEEWVKELVSDMQEYIDETIKNKGFLTEITTTEDGGLEVTDNNHIDLDDEVTFIIDAN